ncbi:DsrE family protein [Pollutibacter soli]|uniref:DsrE family protein n=1 Tax=Pollutibacter soli TaxID=3034157 RepID=UPI003013BBD7
MRAKVSVLVWLLFFCIFFTKTHAQKYQVVFDMTSNDAVNQQALIRQLSGIRELNSLAKMEIVIYGQGLSLVKKDSPDTQDAIKKLIAEPNITFKVCAITMKRNNIDKSQLLDGVQVVPDGIYEIVKRQQEGWGYIKVAH